MDTNMLHIITSTSDVLFRFINIGDLAWFWIWHRGVYGDFFLQFRLATHILRVNYTEKAGDRPGQPAYEMFSIKRQFQQSKLQPPRLNEVCGGMSQRWLSPKSGYFTESEICVEINRKPEKNIPTLSIVTWKKDCQILIICGRNISDTTGY